MAADVVVFASAALAFAARPGRVAAVREAARDPNVRVWATNGTADWLLWRIPDLRGRLAYDVRFELYDEPTLDEIVQYGTRRGDWRRLLNGYRVVVVDNAARLQALAAEPGASIVFRDDEIAVLERG